MNPGPILLFVLAVLGAIVGDLRAASAPITAPQTNYEAIVRTYNSYVKDLLATGDRNMAEGSLLDLSRKYPSFSLPFFHLALIAESRGDDDLAVARFRHFVELEPKSPFADTAQTEIARLNALLASPAGQQQKAMRISLQQFYTVVASGHLDAAPPLLDSLKKAWPTAWQVIVAEACLDFSKKKFCAARDAYLLAAKVSPAWKRDDMLSLAKKSTDLAASTDLATKARAYQAQEKYHDAAIAFEAAWNLTPGEASLAINAADCFIRSKQESVALVLVKRLHKLDASLNLDPLIAKLASAAKARAHVTPDTTTGRASRTEKKPAKTSSMSDEFLQKSN